MSTKQPLRPSIFCRGKSKKQMIEREQRNDAYFARVAAEQQAEQERRAELEIAALVRSIAS